MALLKICGGQTASGEEESAEDGRDGSDRGIFFDLQELEIATDFFSETNRLGTGGFGPVYKVNLRKLCFFLFLYEKNDLYSIRHCDL